MKLNLSNLEAAGYWKSEHSGIWYEKTYKKPLADYQPGEMKIYNWTPVEDEIAIECLEEGMVPSCEAVEAMSEDYAPDSNWTDPSWRSNWNNGL